MAVGTGTRGWNGSSNQTRQLGIKGVSDLLRAAYDEGITFFESADQYGSHPHLGQALKEIPREKVVVLTKTTATSSQEMKEDLDRFRKELEVDYIDIILMHFKSAGDWNVQDKGVMEVLSEAKEEGIIRAHGVSCHSLDALKTASRDPWSEVTLARFNPGQASMDGPVADVREVLETIGEQNKGLIQMKVYGGGTLVDRKDECLQFGLSHSFLNAFTLGLESYEQLKDALNRIPDASVRG